MVIGSLEGGDTVGTRKAWARELYVGAIVTQEYDWKKAYREPIIFTNDDLPRGPTPHRDALVIVIDVQGMEVRRILVDTSNSVNVLYLATYKKLGLPMERLRQVRTS